MSSSKELPLDRGFDELRSRLHLRSSSAMFGLTQPAAYYWAKQEDSPRGKRSAMQGVKFAQLVRATTEVAPMLEVKIGRAAIRVANDFDAEHLRRLVEALGGGADR